MLEAMIVGVYCVPQEALASLPVEHLDLNYAGIVGDRHAGLVRSSGAREPWYPRGTMMRNERQVSILSQEELSEVARAMATQALPPEWIGGNLLLSGLAHLSLLPPRSIMMFPSGAAIRIDGDNGPCRASGRSIADRTGNPEHEFSFVKAARNRRGLVGWVEREGRVGPGDAVRIRVWAQHDYPG